MRATRRLERKAGVRVNLHMFAEGKLTLAVAEITPGDREYDRPRVLVQAFENGYRHRVRREWFECHYSIKSLSEGME